MTLSLRKTVLTLLTALSIVGLGASSYASEPSTRLLPPHKFPLPRFGFDSYNIRGMGERVTHVHWGGLAARMGLEPGDTILRLNGHALTYHGAWNNALRQALYEGPRVRLRIRNVRTGRVAYREIYVGGSNGPITPKSHVGHHDDHFEDHCDDGPDYPIGPITPKSKATQHRAKRFDRKFDNRFDEKFDGPRDLNKSIKKFVNLFDNNDKD